jgi:hypothetical protein
VAEKKLEMTVGDLIKLLAGVNPNALIVHQDENSEEATPLVVDQIGKTRVVLTWHPDYTR